MRTILALSLLTMSSSVFAKGKGGVKLSGVVPMAAEVVIADNGSVVNKGSKDLKVKVQKRGPASVVTVSAP
ncbi:hypothetical protein [Bdellovibrio reynosensis]|uniref:Uncharacterized protein n=1 Tax=Bdellovibrio reynosensis TaxID=2835041 RepID=A0ABY4C5K8_9BACT|nr:hypothetical protein [Bdellovibrio reynosensis]UOF00231.1 hypothetical protein MNR06_11015 [Bdellovibrio reynosensis]